MNNMTLDSKADAALSKLQDTTLNPMEEALFMGWSKANQIKKPDAPEDRVDYRGIYKETGGAILPHGQLNRFADKLNSEEKLRQILHEKLLKQIDQAKQTMAAAQPEQKEPKHGPDEHHSLKLQNEGVEAEAKHARVANEGTHLENKGAEIANEGKKLDIEKILAQREANKDKPKTVTKDKK